MALTKKNHYNPCFWIAFWNKDYLQNSRKKNAAALVAREQEVFVLNTRANQIFRNRTENIFFQKNAGLAQITKEQALDFCRREHPDEYENLSRYYKENPETVILDFENHFSEFENQYRDQLENLLITRRIDDLTQKTTISFFVFTQIIRNHNSLNEAIEFFAKNGSHKFEIFADIKNIISSTKALMEALIPIVSSEWVLYSLEEFRFPISDGCVLMNKENVLLPLAPDLLLKINYHQKILPEAQPCNHLDSIQDDLYTEFIERTIENSDREIVFSEKQLLENLKSNFF